MCIDQVPFSVGRRSQLRAVHVSNGAVNNVSARTLLRPIELDLIVGGVVVRSPLWLVCLVIDLCRIGADILV